MGSIVRLCFMLQHVAYHITWQLKWEDQNMGMSHQRACRRVLSQPSSPAQVRRLVYAVTCSRHNQIFVVKTV